jgi:hypothetical protein
MKLFLMRSKAPVFRHRDVVIDWYVFQRETPSNRPYHELIEGYADCPEDCRDCPETAIDEFFTEEEAAVWAAWLRKHRDSDPELVPIGLPIEVNTMGIGLIPLGGGQDSLVMWKSEHYDLPFRVEGYYDLRHYDPIEAEKVVA